MAQLLAGVRPEHGWKQKWEQTQSLRPEPGLTTGDAEWRSFTAAPTWTNVTTLGTTGPNTGVGGKGRPFFVFSDENERLKSSF